jgi:hypothetical protein
VEVLLSTVKNQLYVFAWTLRRVLAFKKGQHLQPHQVPEAYVREAEIISMPTRIQEAIIFRRGEWPDTSIATSSMYINQNINF